LKVDVGSMASKREQSRGLGYGEEILSKTYISHHRHPIVRDTAHFRVTSTPDWFWKHHLSPHRHPVPQNSKKKVSDKSGIYHSISQSSPQVIDISRTRTHEGLRPYEGPHPKEGKACASGDLLVHRWLAEEGHERVIRLGPTRPSCLWWFGWQFGGFGGICSEAESGMRRCTGITSYLGG
jgi:hypothetical protein